MKSQWRVVVFTAPFLKDAEPELGTEGLEALASLLGEFPESGDRIKGSDGLRKLRVPVGGKGKRGGGRVITFYVHDTDSPIYCVGFYKKGQQIKISADQLKAYNRVTEKILNALKGKERKRTIS